MPVDPVAPRQAQDWEALVLRAREELAAVAAAGGTIRYAELVARLGIEPTPSRAGSLADLLRRVSTEEDRAGRGMLTAVVVRAGSGLPGGGFFRLAEELGRDVADRRRCWQEELARVRAAHAGGPAAT